MSITKARIELVNVSSLTELWILRPEDELEVREEVIKICNNSTKGILVIAGEEGSGKSACLRRVLADDDSISQALDSITIAFWVNCHKWSQPSVLTDSLKRAFDAELVKLANSHDFEFLSSNPMKIAPFFEKKGKRVLYVLDGLNNIALLNHILQSQQDNLSASICIISSAIIPSEFVRKQIELKPMSEQQVHQMLQAASSCPIKPLPSDEIEQLSRCCFGSPLIAKLMSSRFVIDDCSTVCENVNKILASNENVQQKRKEKILYLFDFTFRRLSAEVRNCYYSFLFFEPDEPVSLKDIEIFCDTSAAALLSQLKSASLVTEVTTAEPSKAKVPWPLFGKNLPSSPNEEIYFTVHPLLYEAALQQAIQELRLLPCDMPECLERIRFKLVMREISMSALKEIVMFDAVLQHRYSLCQRFANSFSIDNLAMLCSQTSVNLEQAPNFLQFLEAYLIDWYVNVRKSLKFNSDEVLVAANLFAAIIAKLRTFPEVRTFPSFNGSIHSESFYAFLLDNKKWINQALHRTDNPMVRAIVQNDLDKWFQEFEEVATFTAGGDLERHLAEVAQAAARLGYCGVLEILHRQFKGCVLTAKDTNGLTVVALGAQYGHLGVVKFVTSLDQTALSLKHETNGMTALMYASKNGHLEVVKFIIQEFPTSIAQTTDDGVTPLMLAAQNGCFDVVKLITDLDPTALSRADHIGKTAMMYAASMGHHDVIEVFAELDASQACSSIGMTPLMFAAIQDKPEACIALIQKGADIDAVNGRGNTALMETFIFGEHFPVSVRCLSWLLACPMQTLNHRNQKGETAAGIAFMQQRGGKMGLRSKYPVEAFLSCVKLLQAGAEMHFDPLEENCELLCRLFYHSTYMKTPLIEKVIAIDLAVEMRRINAVNWRKFIGGLLPPDMLRAKYPRPLVAMCRTAILKRLPLGLKARQQAIATLVLPEILQNYLNFTELEAFWPQLHYDVEDN